MTEYDKNMRRNLKYWLKRPVEKFANWTFGVVFGRKMNEYFDIKLSGFENLPDGNAIVVPNHCVLVDGPILATNIITRKRKIPHFWIQKDVAYERYRTGLWAMGDIPIDVDKLSNIDAVLRRTYGYLRMSDDYIGIFGEGPSKNLMNKQGNIIPVKDRKHSTSPAHVALVMNKKWGKTIPIIPIGLRTLEEVEEELHRYGINSQEGAWAYLRDYNTNHKKIPYFINIGKPIFPDGFSEKNAKRDLTERVREEVVKLAIPFEYCSKHDSAKPKIVKA